LSDRRVFLYVQHLLGIGHLKRAATLAQALIDQGSEVTLASGGPEGSGFVPQRAQFVQLPPAATADPSFKKLVDAHGREVDEVWRNRRREALLAAWRSARPHALVLELFPFGRRQMRFELLPLLEEAIAATPRPVIVSSVRDVLGQRDPARQDEMIALFERYFDRVLVHGDPRFLAFDRTFRHAGRLGGRLHYTGYIVDRTPASQTGNGAGAGEVIVSAGGGAVGSGLLQTAIRARPLTLLAARTWRVLTGINIAAQEFDHLAGLAADRGEGRVVVERSRVDFRILLKNCCLSVSQAGYNTIMEVLDAGARAVVVPFSGGTETEQALRARLLAARGRIEVIEQAALSPETLAAAMDRAVQGPKPGGGDVDLGGARKSAELIAQWAAERV
jgi:predicted glycosyltransferase